jgi:hypothetical protein
MWEEKVGGQPVTIALLQSAQHGVLWHMRVRCGSHMDPDIDIFV